jgi:hypothetical protein
MLTGSPLAFGEGGMKERIKRVLNFKKPSRVIVTLAVALVVALSVGFSVDRAIGESSGDWIDYTYDDSAVGVQFSATIPESWTIIERKALLGDLTSEGSPDSCVAFNDSNGNEILGITAMLYSAFALDTENYSKEDFMTDSGSKGVKYYRFLDGHAAVYYFFDANGHNPDDLYYVTGYGPLYFAYIYTSEEEYLKNKADIDAVLDSLVIAGVAFDEPAQVDEPDHIIHETPYGDTALILMADDFIEYYIAWANSLGMTNRSILEESAYNDAIYLTERTIDMFRQERLNGINRPLIFNVAVAPQNDDCITVVVGTLLDDGINREMSVDYIREEDYPVKEIRN